MDEVALADTPGLRCRSPRVAFSDTEADRAKFGCGRGRVTTLGKSVYPERLHSSAKSVSREPVHWYSSAGRGGACGRGPRPRTARVPTLDHAGLWTSGRAAPRPPRRTSLRPFLNVRCVVRTNADNTRNSGNSRPGRKGTRGRGWGLRHPQDVPRPGSHGKRSPSLLLCPERTPAADSGRHWAARGREL